MGLCHNVKGNLRKTLDKREIRGKLCSKLVPWYLNALNDNDNNLSNFSCHFMNF